MVLVAIELSSSFRSRSKLTWVIILNKSLEATAKCIKIIRQCKRIGRAKDELVAEVGWGGQWAKTLHLHGWILVLPRIFILQIWEELLDSSVTALLQQHPSHEQFRFWIQKVWLKEKKEIQLCFPGFKAGQPSGTSFIVLLWCKRREGKHSGKSGLWSMFFSCLLQKSSTVYNQKSLPWFWPQVFVHWQSRLCEKQQRQ